MKNITRRHTPYTKFKAFLDQKNINQREVAEMLEKSTSALNQNLNGTGGDFSVSEVRTICLTYKISADEFFLCPEVSNTKQMVFIN
jgi:transcriptional regulator with XRE-family HTH domain